MGLGFGVVPSLGAERGADPTGFVLGETGSSARPGRRSAKASPLAVVKALLHCLHVKVLLYYLPQGQDRVRATPSLAIFTPAVPRHYPLKKSPSTMPEGRPQRSTRFLAGSAAPRADEHWLHFFLC